MSQFQTGINCTLFLIVISLVTFSSPCLSLADIDINIGNASLEKIPDHVYDVVIVGGGLSGLSAAYYLRDRDIILLEKKKYVGGRVVSRKWGEKMVNFGTQYLPDQKSLIDKFFSDLDIRFYTHRVSDISMGYVHDGQYFSDVTSLQGGTSIAKELIKEVARAHSELKAARKSSGYYLDLDDHPIIDVTAKDKITAGYIGSFVRSTSSAPPNQISQLWYDTLLMDLVSPIKFPVGGMNQITLKLANEIGNRIKTDYQVIKIEDSGNFVIITYVHDNSVSILKSRHCIVSVPAPIVLRLIPDLPEWKVNALRNVTYGSYIVVALKLSRLPTKQQLGTIVDNKIFSAWIDALSTQSDSTTTSVKNPAILVFFIPTTINSPVWKQSDVILGENVIRDLNSIFPGIKSAVMDSFIERFPYGEPIASPGYFRRSFLTKKIWRRIHFAGDYTDEPWVGGAIMSGMRCAQELGASTPWAPPLERNAVKISSLVIITIIILIFSIIFLICLPFFITRLLRFIYIINNNMKKAKIANNILFSIKLHIVNTLLIIIQFSFLIISLWLFKNLPVVDELFIWMSSASLIMISLWFIFLLLLPICRAKKRNEKSII